MPRKPKPSLVLDTETLKGYLKTTPASLPEDLFLSRLVTEGLLHRISRSAPKEAKLLRIAIRNLAVLEQTTLYRAWMGQVSVTFSDKQTFEDFQSDMNLVMDEFADALSLILKGKSQRAHQIPVLRLQHGQLVEYMNEHPYPNTTSTRNRWMQRHLRKIYTLMTRWGCTCTYIGLDQFLTIFTADDSGILKMYNGINILDWSLTPGKTIILLLALLHDSSKPSAIQKSLKPFARKNLAIKNSDRAISAFLDSLTRR